MYDSDGRIVGAVVVMHDVSAAHTYAQEMARSAQHDFLTGLPNRMLLSDRISRAIAAAPRHQAVVAVLFLDLDGFKLVNDTFGHAVGDKLLQSVSRRLVECVRASDTVSRQGGDEFVVLLSEVERAEDAADVARRMLQAVAAVHVVDGLELHVRTSIGVSVYPDDGADPESLIKSADTAMYQAKAVGRGTYCFFKPTMTARAAERLSIEQALRGAMERQEFLLHYQPQVDLRTGAITAAEALLRWTHPICGAMSPASFIPIAESCGLMPAIGEWVLREACQQARAWQDAGLPPTRMAVNISSVQLRNQQFAENLFALLKETRLDPRHLELDVTEAVMMTNAATTAQTLQALRQRGVQVAVDDFGTGFSSVTHLRTFPVNVLKMDQSFIRHIGKRPEDRTMVSAVINMGRSLNLRVVAEGVETPEEHGFLDAHHCGEAQGYYFSRPVAPDAFEGLLRGGIGRPMAYA
jgi:diguanylate cyclase (GGDEF)-like protein